MSLKKELYELHIKLEKERRDRSRNEIEKNSPYSSFITARISSMSELEVYLSLQLKEKVIDRVSLVINVDPEYIDNRTGLTNYERMKQGNPPIDANTGSVIHLHHIGQDFDGPFAEIPKEIHQRKVVYGCLHNNLTQSWREDIKKRCEFAKQRDSHWEKRYQQLYEEKKQTD